MKKYLYVLQYLVFLSFTSLASAAGTGAPDAGSILQQARPSFNNTPLKGLPKIIGPPDQTPSAISSRETFMLLKIEIIGNTIFETTTLNALISNAVGKRQSIAQIFALAGRITDFYQTNGYPLSRAIIPEQPIHQGKLTIKVIEARFGKITIANNSRVNDYLLKDAISSLQSGRIIKESELDHALLLLSDIPGILVNPTLSTGSVAGTSNLLLNISPTTVSANSVGTDNYGNSYTGQENIRANMSIYNPLKMGDVITLNALTSGVGLNYGRVAYESFINGSGARLGISGSTVRYKIGGSLVNLNASGSATIISAWSKNVLLRSRNRSLYTQFQFDRTFLQDHTDAGGVTAYNDRLIQGATASVYGDFHNTFFRTNVTTLGLGASYGRVQFQNAVALANDVSGTNTSGGFRKANLNISRIEGFNNSIALHVTYNLQSSLSNLDSSQKMNAGGPYSVRAFAPGAITGDRGSFSSIELRKTLGTAWLGQWTSTIFVDSASLVTNPNTVSTSETKTALNGMGLGLILAGPDELNGVAYIARPYGAVPALADTKRNSRVALEIKKSF